jgi:hypothetical protein
MRCIRYLMTLLTAFLLGWPMTVFSQEAFESGWYLGGGISYNNVYSYDDTSYGCYGCYGDAEYGDSATDFTLTGGYRVSEYLAVEASYFSESEIGWNESSVLVGAPAELFLVDGNIALESYQLNLLLIGEGRYWQAHLRVGVVFWDAMTDQILTSVSSGQVLETSYDKTGSDYTIGIGIGRRFGDDWQARLDYAYFPIDDRLLNLPDFLDAYADVATLQIVKRFGRSGD